jgi:hypothetical protein
MAKANLSWAELQVYGMGLTAEDLRGGAKHRRTDHPWPLAKEHQEELSRWLEANGFDSSRPVFAQEVVDGDYFVITQ